MFEESGHTDIEWMMRTPLFETFSLIVLLSSLILLTVSTIFQRDLLKTVIITTFRSYSTSIRLNWFAAILLLVNYVIVVIGIVYQIHSDYIILQKIDTVLLYIFASCLIFLPFVNLIIIYLFIGKNRLIIEKFRIAQNILVIKSYLFSALLLLWVFNDALGYYFKISLVLFVSVFYILRIWLYLQKSLALSIRWYYLILYFCTFEILPYAFFTVYLGRMLA